MKLEAVNTRMNPGIEVFPPKDVSPDIGTLDSVDFDSLPLSLSLIFHAICIALTVSMFQGWFT